MKQINFIKFISVYFTISGIIIGAGLISLILWGLKPAIDFVGGSLIQAQIQSSDNNISETAIRDALAGNNIHAQSVQPVSSSGEKHIEASNWIIRTKSQEDGLEQKITTTLAEEFGQTSISRFESIGPTLGKELLTKTLIAILLSAGGILLYVAWRFRGGKYGICANLAMIHDSLVLIGAFSLLGHFKGMEVDTLFVTALLTVLSFSVHDTIVVYDRIRESLKKYPKENFETIANRSVNETMSRSINNSLTIIFMLLALTIFSGTTLKPFALALLIGTITGTYSSPFTAVPLLVIWNRWEQRKRGGHK